MKRRRILKRLKIIAAVFAVPLVLLALAYCWLAYRPSGYERIAREMGPKMAAIQARVRDAAEAKDADESTSASRNALGSSVKRADPEQSLAEIVGQIPQDGSYSNSGGLRELEFNVPYSLAVASEELVDSPFSGLADASAALSPRQVEVLTGFAAATEARDGYSTERGESTFSGESGVPTTVPTYILPYALQQIDLAGAALLQIDQADDPTTRARVLGAVREATSWPVLRAALTGNPEKAERMARALTRFLCAENLASEDEHEWISGTSSFVASVRAMTLARTMADLAQAGLDDATLASLDRIMAASLTTADDIPALRQAAAEDYRNTAKSNIERYIPGILKDSALDFMFNGRVTKSLRNSLRPVLENLVDQAAADLAAGDGNAFTGRLNSIARLGGPGPSWVKGWVLSEPERFGIEQRIAILNSRGESLYNEPIETARIVLAAGRFRLANGRDPQSMDDLSPAYLEPAAVVNADRRWLIVRTPRFKGPDVHAVALDPKLPAVLREYFSQAVYQFERRGPSGLLPQSAADLAPYLPKGTDLSPLESHFRWYEPRTAYIRVRRDVLQSKYLRSISGYDRSDTNLLQFKLLESRLAGLIAGPPDWIADVVLLREAIPDELQSILRMSVLEIIKASRSDRAGQKN